MNKAKGHNVKVVYPPPGRAAVQTGRQNTYFIDGAQFDYVTRLGIELAPDGFNHVTLSFLVREIIFEEKANE